MLNPSPRIVTAMQWAAVAAYVIGILIDFSSKHPIEKSLQLIVPMVIYASAMLGKRLRYHPLLGIIPLIASICLLLSAATNLVTNFSSF